jgi:hypothetical protein
MGSEGLQKVSNRLGVALDQADLVQRQEAVAVPSLLLIKRVEGVTAVAA